MKITGRCAATGMRFIRRQASKPSRPGITASISTRSGVIRDTRRSALSPSVAISTVIPAWSSISVTKAKGLRRVIHHQHGIATGT